MSLTRLRVHAGLWALVALLTAIAVVVVASGAGPVTRLIEDRAIRNLLAGAPSYLDRDLVVIQPTRPALMDAPQVTADDMRNRLEPRLPSPLRESVETIWGYQRTTVSTFDGVGATLTGEGVVAAPHGFAPVVSLLYQPGLVEDVQMVEGEPPQTPPGGDPIEVWWRPTSPGHSGCGPQGSTCCTRASW